jgi:hypothetical protein
MFKKELFIPLWVTLGLGLLLFPWLWDVAHSPDRPASDWFLAGLAAATLIGFHAYWFGVRPRRRRRMREALRGCGYADVPGDDRQLASALTALCPTPFAPTVRHAMARQDGRSRRYLADGFTMYYRNEPRRDNIVENWTYVLESRPLAGRGEVFVLSRADRKIGPLREMPDLTEGLSPAFLDLFRACSRDASCTPVPKALQETLLKPSVPAFLGAFYLKVTPHGWGFCTFPVIDPSWMEKLLRFSDELSQSMTEFQIAQP